MQFEEDQFTLRTLDEHEEKCALLAAGDEDVSKEYGINWRSILLDLYFNLWSGALLPDVMRDILEGALHYETKLVLQHCIDRQKYFCLYPP